MIYNEDNLIFMKNMEDSKVDVLILDPPYYNVVNESWDKNWKSINDYKIWMNERFNEIKRISKMSASMWIFGYPYQLTSLLPLIEDTGFIYRQQIVVWKGMKSAAGRISEKLKMYPTTTESIFFFVKDSRNLIRKILQEKKEKMNISSKEINEYLGKASNGGGTWSSIAGKNQKTLQWPTKNDWIKLNELFGDLPNYEDLVFNFNLIKGLTDVWDDINFYNKKMKKIHPTQKPYELIERLIKTSTNDNSIVLDPFSGSGMTELVCLNNNIKSICIEKDEKYYKDSVSFVKDYKNENIENLFFK
jgi:site-specific DNA-methyltransferase (adenine-specific)